MRRSSLMSMAAIGAVVAGFAGSAMAQAEFSGMGRNDRLEGMSGDGNIAVGWNNQYRGLIWRRGSGWEEVAPPTGFQRMKFTDVSRDGRFMSGHAWFGPENAQQAFRYEVGVGFQMLDDLGPPGDRLIASGDGISGDGSTVAGIARDVTIPRPVRWGNATAPEILGPLNGISGTVGGLALNQDGSRVSAYTQFGSFLWDAENGMRAITPNNTAYSLPHAMSDDGTVVAGGSYAWRWTESTGFMTLPDFPDGRGSWSVEDMSADGTILVGGRLLGQRGVQDAFYWMESTGTQYVHTVLQGYGLDLTGWTLTRVTAVSADGKKLIGEGYNPRGQIEWWTASIPQPLPTPGAVGVLIGVGLFVMRRRR